MNIEINATGRPPYEDYHHEYVSDGVLVGHSDWDTNQRLHVGSLKGDTKNLYAKTPEGIVRKMFNRIAALHPTNQEK